MALDLALPGPRGGRRTARSALALFLTLSTVAAQANLVAPSLQADPGPPALLGLPVETADPAPAVLPQLISGPSALESISRGRWREACAIANAVLAARRPDVEAAAVFALCSAIDNDPAAVGAALPKLRDKDGTAYFTPLVQGILQLHAKRPDLARGAFRAALETRPGDPLATYFQGEALHARGQSKEAVQLFKAVQQRWPGYVPAWTAGARALAPPQATAAALTEAIAMAEQATRLEPASRSTWALLSDLCRRAGQVARADAIALQYLTRPASPR